jgi:nitroreductase
MMLAAWDLGIGSCPNTPLDEARLKEQLGIPREMSVPTVLSLGYPAPGEPKPQPRSDPAGKLARINRLPLATLLHTEAYAG